MLLNDWLKRLSVSHSKFRTPHRALRSRGKRRGSHTAATAKLVGQTEPLEERLLLSAADIELASISATDGFQVNGTFDVSLNEYFGVSVRAAGDVNGDGFEDVIIGARNAANDQGDTNFYGAAYVLYGKSTGFDTPPVPNGPLDPADGFVISGTALSDTGSAVSGAGDINGDGFDDVIVSAPNYSYSFAYGLSSSYVIFGKSSNPNISISSIDSSPSDTTGFRVTGSTSTASMELDAVATGGDINGDGYDDIVFGGSRTTVDGQVGVGAAYVVFGKESGFTNLNISDLNGSNGFSFTNSDVYSSTEPSIGAAVSIGGDINGDGFDDLVVGAPNAALGADPYDGEVYVVFGRSEFNSILNGRNQVQASSLNGTIGFRATGVVGDYAYTGNSLSSGGDINGDGIDDLVIGASGKYYGYGSTDGRAYVVFGKTNLGSGGTLNLTTLSGSSGFELRGDGVIELAGYSVSITGDVNGDGFDDILIGARAFGSDANPESNGAAYLVFGDDDIDVPSNLGQLDGENGFAMLGTRDWNAGSAVGIAGDINGDGFDEILVSEVTSDSGGTVTFIFGKDFGLRDGSTLNGELGADATTIRKVNGSGDGTLSADQGAAADILVGGGGNDTLAADGGADILIGGQGDDVLTADLSNFQADFRFDGGTGVDVLTGGISFVGQTIDLTAIPANRINDIEIIDLEDSNTETLTLDLASVLAITGSGPTTASSSPFATNDAHTLVVLRDADDVVNGIDAGNGWTQGTDETIDGKTFEVFTQAGATVKLQVINAGNGDSNGDDSFNIIDAALMFLFVNGASDGALQANRGPTSTLTGSEIRANIAVISDSGQLDVNGDGSTNIIDPALVFLFVNGASDTALQANRGPSSTLTGSEIRANVAALVPPPSPRVASPTPPPEEEPEQAPQQVAFGLQAPPPDIVTDDESEDEQNGGTNATPPSEPSYGSSGTDEAFLTAQIDVTMDLLT